MNSKETVSPLEQIHSIHDKAVAELADDLTKFQKMLVKYQGTPVGNFMVAALDLRTKHDLEFWSLFEKVIDSTPKNFLRSFVHFVGNCLLDDDCYYIEWHKTTYDLDGNMKVEVSSSEDPDAEPKVIWPEQSHPRGTQDPEPLMKAMEFAIRRREAYVQLSEEVEQMFDALRQKNS